MISIPGITPIFSLLIDRLFPKHSSIPQDFENMWRAARERAELDFNYDEKEMYLKAMTMVPDESYDYMKKRKDEIEKLIGERAQVYLSQQIELYKNPNAKK